MFVGKQHRFPIFTLEKQNKVRSMEDSIKIEESVESDESMIDDIEDVGESFNEFIKESEIYE